MMSVLRRLGGRAARAAFLQRYPGTISIGKQCSIPVRGFRAQVGTLRIGDYVRFGHRVFLHGEAFTFGDHFHCGNDVNISGHRARFEAGKFSGIASDVSFVLGRGRHRLHSLSNVPFGHIPHFESPAWTRAFDYEAESATRCAVGHDVWIGTGCVILANVTIGNGAVVSANSVVKDDVPPYAIVGGNPARVVTFRFKQSLIEELLELKWWDWPLEKINRNIPLFTRHLSMLASLKGVPVED